MLLRQYFTCGNNCEICLKRFTCKVHEGENVPVVDFELDSAALEAKMRNAQNEEERKALWEIAKFYGLNFDKSSR